MSTISRCLHFAVQPFVCFNATSLANTLIGKCTTLQLARTDNMNAL